MPYVYSRPYVYSFWQIFKALRLFPALRLLRTLEYGPENEGISRLKIEKKSKLWTVLDS